MRNIVRDGTYAVLTYEYIEKLALTEINMDIAVYVVIMYIHRTLFGFVVIDRSHYLTFQRSAEPFRPLVCRLQDLSTTSVTAAQRASLSFCLTSTLNLYSK